MESHPAIEHRQVPVITGPLSRLPQLRAGLMDRVVERSRADFSGGGLESLLGEAQYLERQRLKKTRKSNPRYMGDLHLWNRVHGGMLKSAAEQDRGELLDQVLRHYSAEVCGNFDPRLYWIATRVVPFGFRWLLNAASVNHFKPWGMTESLGSALGVVGEIPHVQRLAQKGTILLVPTHQSHVDSVLIGYVIYLMRLPPFAYGAGLNLYSNPVLSFFLNRLGSYSVDRRKSNGIYKTVLKNYSTQILREGIHSIFFPGGGRSRSGAVESSLKLGLLGTALQAQVENLMENRPNPNVYIVPMTLNYHFVLEAAALIEGYLEATGKHRFIGADTDDPSPIEKVIKFFWKFFSSRNQMIVRIGKPLDVFGNFVDEEGRSLGPNGTIIDPRKWLTTRNELRPDALRDREYVRELGSRLADRFYIENTALTSWAVAFSLFRTLRKRYPDLDLYRMLRLSRGQRSVPEDQFMADAEWVQRSLLELADQGRIHVSKELRSVSVRKWVESGISMLGVLHDLPVVKMKDGVVWTEDMNLLYYYRNRLSGYGLSRDLQKDGLPVLRGNHDSQGFLA